MRIKIIFLLLIATQALNAQELQVNSDSLMAYWKGKDALVDDVLNNQDKYRLQILFSYNYQDSLQQYFLGKEQYFYPASLVKLPTVLIALEKMRSTGIKLDDRIVLDHLNINGSKSFINKTRNGISFRELIEKTIVISDNDYYNVLYHFVTPRKLNMDLKQKGLDDVLIYRCFNGCSKDEQLITTGYKVYNSKDSLISHFRGDVMDWSEISDLFPYDDGKKVGNKHMNKGKVFSQPYDFNDNLEFPITSLHELMISFIRDSSDLDWKLGSENRAFVLEKLRQFPKEIGASNQVNDFKIIGFGDPNWDNKRFTTYSKIGYSFGFITETAYVMDRISEKSFFLTISMYVNNNETINDGNYEYSTIATPFMGRLTHIIADELIDK